MAEVFFCEKNWDDWNLEMNHIKSKYNKNFNIKNLPYYVITFTLQCIENVIKVSYK